MSEISRLRAWRTGQGFSLDEVSDLTGISKSMLCRVEHGERTLLPVTKVRMARSLGVRISDLFDVERADTAEAQPTIVECSNAGCEHFREPVEIRLRRWGNAVERLSPFCACGWAMAVPTGSEAL